VQAAVCDDITGFVAGLGWNITGVVPSPLAGRDGNREFLIGAVHD
jgi:23S rRNA (cytidine1920-2'-O)/16S rRNA (cytidine1409-2'-O)-methyltransferase